MSEILRQLQARSHRANGDGVPLGLRALRCATLAGDAGESDELIAACLLHLYGHLGSNPRKPTPIGADHAVVGEQLIGRLGSWFASEVVEPIRLKSAARRYLCWLEPSYFRSLGAVERANVDRMGGAMTDSEAFQFEVHPHSTAAVRLQRYDDLAGTQEVLVLPLDAFRPLLLSQLSRARAERWPVRGASVDWPLRQRAGQRAGVRREDRADRHALVAWTPDPVWGFES